MAGRLGDILIARGLITKDQLQEVLATQSSRGMLGEALVARGLIDNEQLGSALSAQFDVPYLEIAQESVNAQVVRLLPESFARQRLISPISVKGGVMTLAMIAPDDMAAISEAELISGYRVAPVVALRKDVLGALDKGFDERAAARQTVVDIKLKELEELRAKGVQPVESSEDDRDAPIVKLVNAILLGAVNAGASDIHLEPFVPQMRVRYRVDGDLQQVMTIPNQSEATVVSRIKVMANLDTTETRRPQDGNLTILDNGSRASFRVSTIPVAAVGNTEREKVVLRVVDERERVFTFSALGMPELQTRLVTDLLNRPHGMIAMTGPTGSGKTTTMYTMLMNLDSSLLNISTIEDPVEFRLQGINQVHANAEYGLGFGNALKYLMRQDPDVIMVGEIRDHETAVSAVQAALTGHLLITTLHTNDAVGAIPRLNDLGIDYFKIAGALLGVIAQRLLRGICKHCKTPWRPNTQLLDKLVNDHHVDIPSNAQFYKGQGCSKCLQSGYVGRIPIYEIMSVTPHLQKAIESGLPHSKLREFAVADGMVELAQAGMVQALAGRTSLEEVYFRLSG